MISIDMKRKVVSSKQMRVLKKKKKKHSSLIEKNLKSHEQCVQTATGNDVEVRTFSICRSYDIPVSNSVYDFIKRRLWCHMICIYDEVRRKHYLYVWPESVASRGSQEIGSCLYKHLSDTIPIEAKKIVLFCDSYGGQTRNLKLTLMMKKFLDSWPNNELSSIEQRYFVVGHSYNSCDKCFELIHKKLKTSKDIFIPSDLVNLIHNSFPKCNVIEMHTSNFLSLQKIYNIIDKTNLLDDKKKIIWSTLQHIVLKKESPNVLETSDYTTDNILYNHINLQIDDNFLDFSKINLDILYPNGRPIDEMKYNDLQSFLQVIPPECIAFYTGLKKKSVKTPKDFVLCACESSDEENVINGLE